MNTNRSTKLGTVKALRRFGPRKGAEQYNLMQWTLANRKLSSMIMAPSEKMSAAFKRLTAAASSAVMDFHQFAKFLHHGPINPELSLQDHLAQPLMMPRSQVMWLDTGSPGVSCEDITTMAQQYAYLHPQPK